MAFGVLFLRALMKMPCESRTGKYQLRVHGAMHRAGDRAEISSKEIAVITGTNCVLSALQAVPVKASFKETRGTLRVFGGGFFFCCHSCPVARPQEHPREEGFPEKFFQEGLKDGGPACLRFSYFLLVYIALSASKQ